MATPDEERKIKILVDAQAANASIRDMGAGVSLLKNQLEKMAADDPRRAQLKRDFDVLSERVGEARTRLRSYAQTEEEAAEAARKLQEENQRVVLNGQKVSATFREMESAAQQLESELKDLSADDPGRKRMLADYHALQERIEGVKNELGGAKEESSSFLTEALAFGGATVGAEAVLEGVKELGAEIINTTREVSELRAHLNTLTGASGAELDELSTSVMAVSRTFGKDFNEVIASSNTLSKQMGVSQQEALRLIQQGFLAGADAGGDFLDQVKEYAPQFKNAGFAASEFIGHISQASTQGIFSDKGADVVKEFGLRIREQTKATSEALQAAFGSDFTKEIFDGINNGTLTVEQALQRVGKEMDETQIPANQLQTVIADVFGGPGEDAGIDYLKSLKNVGKGIDELVDKTNPYTAAQQRLLESQTDLAEAQNQLTQSFQGGGNAIEVLKNQGLTVLWTLLVSLGATFKEMFAPVQQLWQSLTELGVKMGWMSDKGITAKGVGEALGATIRLLNTGTRWLVEGLSWLVSKTADWVKGNETARTVLEALTFPLRTLFELISNAPAYLASFTAAFGAAFDSIGKAWELLKTGDFAGAKAAFAGRGEAAGRAFRQAFDAAMAEKANSSASSADAGDDNQPTRAQGGDGQTDAAKAKAAKDREAKAEKDRKARQAAQDKAEREQLAALQRWAKAEGSILEYSSELERMRQEAANTDELKRRYLQRKKLLDEARQKCFELETLEGDHSIEIGKIIEERDLALREQQAKWDEQDQKERQQKLDEQLQQVKQEAEANLAQAEALRANEALSQEQFEEALFQIKQERMTKELALIKQKYGEESAEYRKLQAEKLQAQTEHGAKAKKQEQDRVVFDQKMAAMGAHLLGEGLRLVEDNLDKKSEAYAAFKAARKAAELAELGINLWAEIQAIWKASAENPLNGVTAGGAGTAQGVLLTGLAVARAAGAGIKIAGFAQGGETGPGLRSAGTAVGTGFWPMLKAATGLSVDAGGQMRDAQGLAVAGIVHKNEYVIPEWLRADPQVVQVESWLEARRLRGYYQGGPTSEGSRPAMAGELPGGESAAGSQAQLVQVLGSLDQRLRQVEQWPTQLEVYLDLLDLDREQEKVRQVKARSGLK